MSWTFLEDVVLDHAGHSQSVTMSPLQDVSEPVPVPATCAVLAAECSEGMTHVGHVDYDVVAVKVLMRNLINQLALRRGIVGIPSVLFVV